MSLIYRAIWQDDRSGLVEAASAVFERWAVGKHPGLRAEPGDDGSAGSRSAVASDGRRVELSVHGGTEDALAVTEASLVEDGSRERWSTRLRVLDGGEAGERWLWIDLERVTDTPFERPEIAAPRVVRELIDDGRRGGGDPRAGSVPLEAGSRLVETRAAAEALAATISDPDRAVPVAVFTHADGERVPVTMLRAGRTAERLAGVCSVHVLRPEALRAFNEAMGDRMGVWGGAARLYLPGSHPPTRHRFLRHESLARDPLWAGRTFGLMLSQSVASRRAPPPYERARRLLRQARGGGADGMVDYLETEVEELETELAERKAELDTQRDLYVDLASDQEDDGRTIEELRRRVKFLQRQLDGQPETSSEREVDEVSFPSSVDDPSHAAAFCREHLNAVVLHEKACRDLELLDRSVGSLVWGRTALKGLFALQAYVSERNADGVAGNFWTWCERSGHAHAWPATDKKLAMSESESVLSNESLKRCRVLPVDSAVDPSGAILMQAHLKIAEGGGDLAPRIYFHDDTAGRTGKVHVGFFGPHRHMPNTRTN